MKMEGYAERERLSYEREVTIAWMNAVWGRAEKIPDLKDILKRSEPEQELTEEQADAILAARLKDYGDRLRRNANLMDPAQ